MSTKSQLLLALEYLVLTGERHAEIRTFGTMTEDLLTLRDWLNSHGVTHVAMESTGVYWKPVYYLLEEEFNVILINAAHVKNVPGRKIPQLRKALRGQFGKHHVFLVELILKHIDTLDEAINACSEQIAEQINPFVEAVNLLDTIPGIDRKTAEVLISEIGTDMSRFPTAQHLASWAGMCPGNNESAGKRKSGKSGKGSKWLRSALVEAARAASHQKDTYLSSQYHRLVRGDKKAIVAVAHSILVIAYYMLKNGTEYQDLGADFFDRRNVEKLARRYLAGLHALVTTYLKLQKLLPNPFP